jgi:hypothetical protein
MNYLDEETEKTLLLSPEETYNVLFYLIGYMKAQMILQSITRKDGFSVFREGLDMALVEFGKKKQEVTV